MKYDKQFFNIFTALIKIIYLCITVILYYWKTNWISTSDTLNLRLGFVSVSHLLLLYTEGTWYALMLPFCQYPVWTICHWFTLNTYDTHRHCILSVKCEPFAAGSHGMRTIQISTAFWECQYDMDKCCDLSASASSVNHSLLYSKSASFAVVAPCTVMSRPLYESFPHLDACDWLALERGNDVTFCGQLTIQMIISTVSCQIPLTCKAGSLWV